MKKASFLFLTSLLIVTLPKSQSGFRSSTPISLLPFEQKDNTTVFTATTAFDPRGGKAAKRDDNPFKLMKSQQAIRAIANEAEQTDILINSGGSQYTDGQGRTWMTDTYFSGGKAGSKSFDVSGTTDDALYLNYRYASTGIPFSYNIPLPAGSYNISFHFMEPFFGAPGGSSRATIGARVFNVNIEGQRVLSNYDIYAEGGAASAVVKTFNAVSVTDGTLNILFTSVVNKAIISAIEIVDASGTDNTPPTVNSVVRFSPTSQNTTATQVTYQVTFSEEVSGVDNSDFTITATGTVSGSISNTTGSGSTYQVTVSSITGTGTLRLDVKSSVTDIEDLAGKALSGGFITGETYNIGQAQEGSSILVNCGGTQYRDGQGRSWIADTYFSGGKTGSKSFDVSGTSDDALYLSYRYAASSRPLSYNIPLQTGTYNISLHFMEPSLFATGARIFHVSLEGQQVLTNYDIYAESGAARAIVKTFNGVSVTDGTLNILFTSVTNNAIICAIEIEDASGPDNTPPIVSSILRFNPTTQNITGTSVTYQVTFSEAVSGVDNSDFQLTTTGSVAGSISNTSGFGNTYQVTVSGITGTGTLRLDVKASNTGITDLAVNALSIGFISGETYNIQQTPADFTIINGPYLQVGTQTAMTIRWRTDVATDSRIEVGTVFGTYPLTASSSSVTKEHEVRITGLNPDTKYYYRVGSSTGLLPGSDANYFKTAPPPNTTRKIRVAIFGDSGVSDEALENRQGTVGAYLNYTGGNPAELILFNGDNAERDGTDADYQKYFFGFFSQNLLKNHVLFTAPGNNEYHEFPQTSRSQAYFKLFSMPTAGEGGGIPSNNKSFYSFNWGNIHFISLDSYGIESDGTRIYDTSGALTTWLKKDLAANTQKWTIAFFHHPPYTMGSHNSDTEGELIRIRQNFIPILERYGVDLVVNGHSHDYERSYLLNNYYGKEADFKISLHTKSSSSGKYNNSSNSCPYITASQTANHGTVYVVSASSFAFSTSVQSSFPHAALPFASYGSANGGMLYLEIEDNRLDARFIRRDGVISDQFTIMHDVNRTTSINIAAGETAQLTASWIGNYRWSTGATGRTISVSPGSNTTYRVTDNFGCLADAFNVNVTNSALTLAAKQSNSLTEQTSFYPTQVKKGSPVTLQINKAQVTEVTLVDAGGRLIRSIRLNGNTRINTEGLAAGVYFLILETTDAIKTEKLIITD